MFRVWMAALAAGVLAPVAAAEPDEALELKSAWVRALPPFQPNTSAYLTLVNTGEAAVAIVGASSDVAEKVEIHRTREVDGLMRMEQLDGLALAPGDLIYTGTPDGVGPVVPGDKMHGHIDGLSDIEITVR